MDDQKNTEDVLELASKTWNRLTNAAVKAGFREGIEDGRQSVFQEGFDKGYKEAFKTAFELGRYKGLAAGLPKDHNHPLEISSILDKTRRGECYICLKNTRTKKSNETFDEKSIDDIIEDQRKHSTIVLDRLHEYFELLMKDCNVDISETKL
ncbi:yae1 domain-containing protein 1 [Cephus cinctus]|uniref:Yae1 domain-containing protein 1 n=1 Tax=Cephus cinctus TaxID=211228 RepID=A0AAJ7BFN5_CEPCN|nr:yae1 domain-containing protein 1 [Cephus cinctus]XP_015584836.1 yae1 domain-containing protein 1 [Cephus cinctus]XP_015584837.1 yae1 domain-containing protein 1 [Cephus cinctus]XP_015584838.1 yae1 domain-containing protein 1 [Cephus cinctus]XP_015584840.1 yae1 domain-containing protein 1 [Cephus cinctus]